MLHLSTIEPATLDLLKSILKLKEFKNFYLVGGTALSLKHGHRISVDLDLFSTENFEKEEILNAILDNFPNTVYKRDNNPVGIFCEIDGVKVDIIKHHFFKLIRNVDIIEDVRMFSDEDIAAMKIFAILKRSKKKDFYDLEILLRKFNLRQIIDFYHQKYPDNMMLISIPQAIIYFHDAEEDENPISINGQTWESVKLALQKHVREFLA